MLDGWTRVEIGGKPADVFEPGGGDRPRFGVLFLHPVGGESPADDAAYTAAFCAHRLAVVAPHGGQSWWADRVCPSFDPAVTAERHLLDAVVPWADARWGLGPKRLAAAGISMGGQGAVRLGFKYPGRFPVVASVAGAFDYHERWGQGGPLDEMYASRERCRQDTAVLHVHATRWPPHVWLACDPDDAEWFRGNDRLHEKLSALGVPHAADFDTTAGGHPWAYFDRMAGPLAAWLVAAMAAEGRRLA